MAEDTFNKEKIKQYWILSAEKDFLTMQNLFVSKDFHWALFLGHLVVEKYLKARIVEITASHPPFSHDLRKLAKLAEIELNDSWIRLQLLI